jgi:hypothetical protein
MLISRERLKEDFEQMAEEDPSQSNSDMQPQMKSKSLYLSSEPLLLVHIMRLNVITVTKAKTMATK